jgi:hypothetical protein
VKELPKADAGEATAELQGVMGGYWVAPEGMRALRHDVSDPGVTL